MGDTSDVDEAGIDVDSLLISFTARIYNNVSFFNRPRVWNQF